MLDRIFTAPRYAITPLATKIFYRLVKPTSSFHMHLIIIKKCGYLTHHVKAAVLLNIKNTIYLFYS